MRRRLEEGAQTLLTLNIFSLQGAGAEGPTAVSCNRTSLFVSAQGSLRAINGTQYPLCRELVSVSLETDKHIIHKCQTQCARSVTWWRKGFWDWSVTVIPMLCTDNIWDFIKREERSGHTPGPVEQTVWLYGEEVHSRRCRFGKHRTVLYSSTVI